MHLTKTIIKALQANLLLLFTLYGAAQEKVFLNVNQEVTEEKFAYYTQVSTKDSSGTHCLKITYNNGANYFNGCITNSIYSAGKERKYAGLCKWYYKNGNLKQVATYNAQGEFDGKVSSYHENGSLKTTADYKNGIRTTKKLTFFTETGNQYTLFQEDFKANNNDWEVYQSELNEAYIEKEQFVLTSLTNRGTSRYISMPISAGTYEIELEIAPPSDKRNAPIKGLIYNYSSWDNYNYYIIQGNYFSVGRYVDGVHQISADMLSTMRVKEGEENTLKIKNELDICQYFINGELVHKSSPQSIKYERVGMIIGGEGTARFNKLSIKEMASTGSRIKLDDEEVKGSGSGFLISQDGYIITNHHVVEGATRVFVEFPALEESYLTRVVLKDETSDLALLKIDDSSYVREEPIPYMLSSDVKDVGSEVFTLGYPFVLSGLGKEIKFADGKISSKTGFDNDIFIYQTTIPIQPGNSGSPMFDKDGNVVGCMNAVYRNADNVSYSIKSNFVKTFIQSTNEKVTLPTQNNLQQLDLTEKIKKVSNNICIVKVL